MSSVSVFCDFLPLPQVCKAFFQSIIVLLTVNPCRNFVLKIIFAENLVEHDFDVVAGGHGEIKKDE